MTILAVDKKKNEIHVGSDSRYTIGEYRLDCGPKVFEVVAHFSDPGSYRGFTKVGFAFDGDVTFFFSLKSKLDMIFGNLMIYPYQDSIDEIMIEKIEEICDEISKEYSKSLSEDGQYRLTNCIGTQVLFFFKSVDDGQTLKAYCFTCDENYKFDCKEIPDGETFYGSGAEKAEGFYSLGLYENIVRFLMYVIEHAREESIGGAIQLGKLDESGFNIIGYQDFDGFKYVYHLGNAVVQGDNFVPQKTFFYEVYSEAEIVEMQKNYVAKN